MLTLCFCFCAHHRFLRAADPAADTLICDLRPASASASLLRIVCHAALNLGDDACSLESLIRSGLFDLSLFLRDKANLTVDTFYLVPVDTSCLTYIELRILLVPYSLKHISMLHPYILRGYGRVPHPVLRKPLFHRSVRVLPS